MLRFRPGLTDCRKARNEASAKPRTDEKRKRKDAQRRAIFLRRARNSTEHAPRQRAVCQTPNDDDVRCRLPRGDRGSDPHNPLIVSYLPAVSLRPWRWDHLGRGGLHQLQLHLFGRGSDPHRRPNADRSELPTLHAPPPHRLLGEAQGGVRIPDHHRRGHLARRGRCGLPRRKDRLAVGHRGGKCRHAQHPR